MIMDIKQAYNKSIDIIFDFLKKKNRIILQLIILLILVLVSYKFFVTLFFIFLFLIINTVIESYRLFLPGIPVDFELLTFGAIFLTLRFDMTITLIFLLLGLISMTISRGHFHPSFLIKITSLFIIALVISTIDYTLLKAMIILFIGIIIQFIGYILLGGDPVRNTIARLSNLLFNYFLLTTFL